MRWHRVNRRRKVTINWRLVNALTSVTRQGGNRARDKPKRIWLTHLIPAKEGTRCVSRVVKSLARGPYHPVINPSNFTTRIDNPYFPLFPGTTFTYLNANRT